MNRTLLILLLIFPTLGFASDIDKFLKEFEKAASKKDKKALKEMIYPLKLDSEDVQENMVKAVLADDQNSSGDGAISVAALKKIRNDHMDAFQVVPDVLYEDFKQTPDMGNVINKFKQKEVLIFDHNGARMILVKDKSWKFLFWENLNSVL